MTMRFPGAVFADRQSLCKWSFAQVANGSSAGATHTAAHKPLGPKSLDFSRLAGASGTRTAGGRYPAVSKMAVAAAGQGRQPNDTPIMKTDLKWNAI